MSVLLVDRILRDVFAYAFDIFPCHMVLCDVCPDMCVLHIYFCVYAYICAPVLVFVYM
jgi:hypothetical protein